MSNTANMGIPLDIPGSTPGPVSGVFGGVNQWATDNEGFKNIVDAHDHSSGKGLQVQPAGLNISSDLSFQGNNATNLRTFRLSPQASQPSGGSDLSCGWATTSGELSWINSAGQNCQITVGGSLDLSSNGGITGLIPPAALTWSPTLPGFVLTSTPTVPASLATGTIFLGVTGATNPKTISIQSPNSLASNYTITLPAAVPVAATSSLVQMSTTGIITVGNSVSGVVTVPSINIPGFNSGTIASVAGNGYALYNDQNNQQLSIINSAGSPAPVGRFICKSMTPPTSSFSTVDTLVAGGRLGNTATPTIPFYIPANAQVYGSVFKVHLSGTCTSSANNLVNLNIHNGPLGTLSDPTAVSLEISDAASSGSNIPFDYSAEIYISSTGASASGGWNPILLNQGTTGIAQAAVTLGAGSVTGTAFGWPTTSGQYFTFSVNTAVNTTTLKINAATVEFY